MTTIATALETIRPMIADRYAQQIRRTFERMVEKHGPSLDGIYNSWDFSRTYRSLVAQYVTRTDGVCSINEDRLAQGAAAYAEAATTEWQAKIESKLGNLELAVVSRHQGTNFTIVGRRNGHSVAIEQDMIVKSSTRGLLFNQFPARIYVDGKFMAEKKYHAMFA